MLCKSMENKIVKFCLLVWGMLLYGVIHGSIARLFFSKFAGISEVIYSAYNSSELLSVYTVVILTCATFYFACRNYGNHYFSWNKLYVELVAIEVLWFIPYDWKVSSVGVFPISLFHLGVILVFALIVADIVRWLYNHYEVRPIANELPYTIDTISEVQMDDERALYADNILSRIQAVENDSDSYAIIVYGEWGAGKTVFLKYIEHKLSAKRQEVLLFNPWKCQTPQQINSDFLSLLAGLLKKYDSSLEKPFLRYSDLLDSIGAPKGIEYLLSLFGNQDETLTEIRDHLIESLSQIKVPVYILIDDLDRMDADEILAVVRLIRNTANFPYLKFLVMCDRTYLLEKLTERNISPEYLQKIFMAEFYLPSIYSEYPCVDACKEDVSKMTNDIFVNGFFKNLYFTNSAIIEKSLKNIRQAKRFARELVTDWDFAKNNKSGQQYEIWYNDYIWIELLRYTNLACYQKLELTPTEYFDVRQNSRYKVNMYVLKEKYLSKEYQEKLEVLILQNIFRYKDDGSVSFRSMSLLENYDKYFSFGKSTGHLSHSEYIDLLHHNGSKEELDEKVASMSVNKVFSLQHLVMMTKPQKLSLELQKGYLDIFYALCSRLSSAAIQKLVEQKVNSLFGSHDDADSKKDYLKGRLKETSGNYKEVLASNGICRQLLILLDDSMPTIFAKDELKAIIRDNFKKYLAQHQCDAADIVRNTQLNRVVSLSVLEYPVEDEVGYLYSEYDCLVFDEIIECFSRHKSQNLQAAKDFETLELSDDLPQPAYDDAVEEKQDEIQRLFGSLENFEKYKAECFVS